MNKEIGSHREVAADLVYTEDQAVVRLVARLEAPEKSP